MRVASLQSLLGERLVIRNMTRIAGWLQERTGSWRKITKWSLATGFANRCGAPTCLSSVVEGPAKHHLSHCLLNAQIKYVILQKEL